MNLEDKREKETTLREEVIRWNARILPPAPWKCQRCAKEHKEREPHDANSFYYKFYMLNVVWREATREEAMAHCPEEVKEKRTKALERHGIDIKSTKTSVSIPQKEPLSSDDGDAQEENLPTERARD